MAKDLNKDAEVEWGIVQRLLAMLEGELGGITPGTPHYADAQRMYEWVKLMRTGENPMPATEKGEEKAVERLKADDQKVNDRGEQRQKGRPAVPFLFDHVDAEAYTLALTNLINIYYDEQTCKMQMDGVMLAPSTFFAFVFTASVEFGLANVAAPVKKFFDLFAKARARSDVKQKLTLGYEAINDQVKNISRLSVEGCMSRCLIFNISESVLMDKTRGGRRRLSDFRAQYNKVKGTLQNVDFFRNASDQ